MAATRGNLIQAMVNYLKDQSNAIATYLDAAAVRGFEYINTSYGTSSGEAMVSITPAQTVVRANAGNIDEVYSILVSMRAYQRSHDESDSGLQAIVNTIREELVGDFQANRTSFWTYFSPLDTGNEVLSTKFNSVELGIVETVIDSAAQNARVNFMVFVNLTRSR